MEVSDSDNSDNEPMTPPELTKETEEHVEVDPGQIAIPEYSKEKYFRVYDVFKEWQESENYDGVNEYVMMAYFEKLNETKKPSTLWSQYSMLKSTMNIKDNLDISKYKKLRAYLKKQGTGFRNVKSQVLTSANIHDFLIKASDYEFLTEKVIMILGIVGACRKSEIVDLTMSDIVDTGTILIVTIQGNPRRQMRKFTIDGDLYTVVKKYLDLRPKNAKINRLLLNYQKGRCTQQPIGINKIGGIPRRIAAYLELPDPDKYTGHCFRRSSQELLAQSGTNVVNVIGGWKAGKSSGETDNPLQIYSQMEASTILKTSLDTQQLNNSRGNNNYQGQSINTINTINSINSINSGQSSERKINTQGQINKSQTQVIRIQVQNINNKDKESEDKTLNLDGFKFVVVEIDRRVEVVQKGWSPPEGAEYVKARAIFDSYKSASDYADTINVKKTPRVAQASEIISLDADSSSSKANKVINSQISTPQPNLVTKKINFNAPVTGNLNNRIIGTLVNKNTGNIQVTSGNGVSKVIKTKRFIGTLVNKNFTKKPAGGPGSTSNIQNLNSRNIKSGNVLIVVEKGKDSSNVITGDVTQNSNPPMQVDTKNPILMSNLPDANILEDQGIKDNLDIKEEFVNEEFIEDNDLMVVDPVDPLAI